MDARFGRGPSTHTQRTYIKYRRTLEHTWIPPIHDMETHRGSVAARGPGPCGGKPWPVLFLFLFLVGMFGGVCVRALDLCLWPGRLRVSARLHRDTHTHTRKRPPHIETYTHIPPPSNPRDWPRRGHRPSRASPGARPRRCAGTCTRRTKHNGA